MNGKEIAKLVILSAGVFGIITAANIASEAIYTNSKVGLDKKTLLKAGVIGIGLTSVIMYIYKK